MIEIPQHLEGFTALDPGNIPRGFPVRKYLWEIVYDGR